MPSHQLESHELDVTEYHDCLGLIPPYHDTSMPGGWIPKNMLVTGFCPRVFSFLQTSGESRQLVNSKMVEVAAVVEWETHNGTSNDVELTCIITNTMKDAQTKAKTWCQDVPQTFLDALTKHFASDKVETLQEAWQMFRERIDVSVSEADPSKIVVEINDDECSICMTGLRDEVENLSSKLKDEHAKVQEEMKRAATIVTETKTGFSLQQLRMLEAKAFKSKQQKKFTDLTVEIDTKSQEVRFTGMPGDVTTAMSEMYGVVNNMVERSLKMPASLISLLHGKPMMKQVVRKFINEHICAVYTDVGGDRLGVYALSDEHLDTAIEILKATTCEKSVDADVNKMSVPQKWTELLDDQQSEHDGFLRITESENMVVITGEKSHVENSLREIKTFLAANIISEQFVAMEHGVASYIDKYLAEEIEGVKKTIRHATITAKLDGPYGYSVVGDSNGVQSAVRDFQRWQNDIKVQQLSVDKPGLPKFLTSVAGQQSLQSLERQHQVVIEPVGKYVQKGDVLAPNAGPSAVDTSFMSRVTLPDGATVEHSTRPNTQRQQERQPAYGSRHAPSSRRHHVTSDRGQTPATQKTQLKTPEGITLTLSKSEIAKEQVCEVTRVFTQRYYVCFGWYCI